MKKISKQPSPRHFHGEITRNSITAPECFARSTPKIAVDVEDYEIHLKCSLNGQKSAFTISEQTLRSFAESKKRFKWICLNGFASFSCRIERSAPSTLS
jgi:hypothetical protein